MLFIASLLLTTTSNGPLSLPLPPGQTFSLFAAAKRRFTHTYIHTHTYTSPHSICCLLFIVCCCSYGVEKRKKGKPKLHLRAVVYIYIYIDESRLFCPSTYSSSSSSSSWTSLVSSLFSVLCRKKFQDARLSVCLSASPLPRFSNLENADG